MVIYCLYAIWIFIRGGIKILNWISTIDLVSVSFINIGFRCFSIYVCIHLNLFILIKLIINIQSQKDFWDILYFLLIILLTSLFLLVATIQTLKLTNWYIWILYSLFDWHFNHLSNEEKDHLNISAFSKSSKSRRLMILDQIKYPISYTIVDNVPSTYLPKMEREVRDFGWEFQWDLNLTIWI